jgi:hypothetical protein
LTGKTLLIHDEQGFGDTFQFIRLVPWAKERSGARIVLQIIAEQRSFAERIPGVDQIILRGEVPPPFDMHCEMMSLPLALNLKLTDLPGEMPYLSASPKRLAHWKKRLARLRRPLVALNWAGRPTIYNGQNRSICLETLAPLSMQGVTFLSVQKGDASLQGKSPPPGMNFVDLSDEIKDFDDTAAILDLADLLISIDSAPAHLAGALGRPAWVMLGYVADWRWLQERSDSPWYPSLRLFRQPQRDDWASVVSDLRSELDQFRDKRS